MSEEQITPKRRGRPPKKVEQHETPTIKEGAHWQVGVPDTAQEFADKIPAGSKPAEMVDLAAEVDELKRRHNEAMQNNNIKSEPPSYPRPWTEIMGQVPPEESNADLTADSAIQIKEGPNRGVICQVGQVEGELVMCYQQLANGEKTFLSTKMGEFIVLCPRRPGLVARKWEKKETAPNWHENKTHTPESH